MHQSGGRGTKEVLWPRDRKVYNREGPGTNWGEGAPDGSLGRCRVPEVGTSWRRGPIHEDLSPEQGGEALGGSTGGEQGHQDGLSCNWSRAGTCPPARPPPVLPARDRMCRGERLVVAGPGGWSRAAGRFLNISPAGPAASEGGKQAAGALPAYHPCPGLGLARAGERDGKGVRDRERDGDQERVRERQTGRDGRSDRDGKSQRESDVKRRRWGRQRW